MTVQFRFSEGVAKQAGVLSTLLEFQGVTVRATELGASPEDAGPVGDTDLLLVGLPEGAPELSPDARPEHWERALIMILNPGSSDPPAGVLEFSSDGLQRLLRRLGRPLRDRADRPATAEERRMPGPERRRWDLKRFRYGLWLEFARATGSGKFDPYPLTTSKRHKVELALVEEMRKYEYEHEHDGPWLLSSALDHVWDSFDDRFPCAVHVVDALAEHIWEAAAPRMPERRTGPKRRVAESATAGVKADVVETV